MKHIEFDFSLRIFCEMRMKRFISRCQIMLLYVQRKFSENSELLIMPEKHSDFKSLLYFIQKARQILCSLKIWGNYSRNENFYDYYQITIKSGVKKEIMSTRRTFLIYFSSFILINNGKLKCQKVLKATFMKIPLF